MSRFLGHRLATIVPTLLFVSMLVFGLQQLLPGDAAVVLAGEDQDPNVVAYLRAKLHLDEPLPVRYAYWLGGVAKGDLGMNANPLELNAITLNTNSITGRSAISMVSKMVAM